MHHKALVHVGLKFNVAPRPYGLRTIRDAHLDFHAAPELWTSAVKFSVHRDRTDC